MSTLQELFYKAKGTPAPATLWDILKTAGYNGVMDAEPGDISHWDSDDKDHRKQTDGSWLVVGSEQDKMKKDPSAEKSEARIRLETQEVNKKKLANITKKSMSEKQLKAVTRYTGKLHEPINDFSRNGTPNPEAEKDAKLIKAGIKNTKIPAPMTVHRKCHDEYLLKIFNVTELNPETLMGKEATDNGIISTSLKQTPSGIKGKHSIYFNLPEGYNAAYIEKISQHRGQEEMILLCETRFKPKTIKPNERGGYDIEVDL